METLLFRTRYWSGSGFVTQGQPVYRTLPDARVIRTQTSLLASGSHLLQAYPGALFHYTGNSIPLLANLAVHVMSVRQRSLSNKPSAA